MILNFLTLDYIYRYEVKCIRAVYLASKETYLTLRKYHMQV